jgi:hypothetical protein
MQGTSQSTSPDIMASTIKKTPSSLRVIDMILLILLAAQFLIGMLVNLFVQVPTAHPGANASNYFVGVAQDVAWALFNTQWELLIHVVVGLLLFILSIVLLVLAIISRRGKWITISILGLIGIMGAGFNGASFMNYGGLNISSLLMSIGFLLAAICYTIGISFRH